MTYNNRVSVILVTQHTKRMRRVMLSFVACLWLSQFSTLSNKQHHFRNKVIDHKVYVLVSSKTFVRKISNSKKNSEIIHKFTQVTCIEFPSDNNFYIKR